MQDILTLGRSKELSKARASHMEAALQHPIKSEPVNQIRKTKTGGPKKIIKTPTTDRSCGLCGGAFPHLGECPVKGRKCAACGKLSHYAKVCRSTPQARTQPKPIIQTIERPEEDDMDDDTDEESVHFIHALNLVNKRQRPAPRC